MTARHDPALSWMIGALAGGVALAVVVLAGCGIGPSGLAVGVRMTARWSFLFFWPSYAGASVAILFGPAFSGLASRTRSLGLAFAAAMAVHIGLVVWLGVAIGRIPLQGGLLWVFVVALCFTVLLTLFSFGIKKHSLGRFWRPLLLLATTYILVAFGLDFVRGALGMRTRGWLYAAEYLPFAVLSLIAIPLRLSAFLRPRFDLHSAAPTAQCEQEPAI